MRKKILLAVLSSACLLNIIGVIANSIAAIWGGWLYVGWAVVDLIFAGLLFFMAKDIKREIKNEKD